MKWMLITAILYNPVIYKDEATCKAALMELHNVDYAAACIPAGDYKHETDHMFDKFFDMVLKLQAFNAQNTPYKEVDKLDKE